MMNMPILIELTLYNDNSKIIINAQKLYSMIENTDPAVSNYTVITMGNNSSSIRVTETIMEIKRRISDVVKRQASIIFSIAGIHLNK